MKLKKMNNKSGFTLLEIIVVIIIVGVLASLALPRFFETIEFSRSTEAMNTLGSIKRGAERCSMMGGVPDYTGCDTLASAGFTGVGANAHFAYAVDATGHAAGTPSTGSIAWVATRNTVDGGTSTDTITMTVNVTTGVVTKVGIGSFATIK